MFSTKALSHKEEFSAQLWATPANIASSERAVGRWMETGGTQEEALNFAKSRAGILKAGGAADADAYITTSSMRTILENQYRVEGKDISAGAESIERTIKEMQGQDFVTQIGRNPVKDAGTIGLYNARVLTDAQETMAIELSGLSAEEYHASMKGRIILDPMSAKVMKADYDGDSIIMKFFGLNID